MKTTKKPNQKNKTQYPKITENHTTEATIKQLLIQQILKDGEIIARWHKNPFYIT